MRSVLFLLIAFCLLPGTACMPSESSPAIADLVAACMAVWNGADDAALDTLVAPDFVRTGDALSESAEGVPALRSLVRKMRIDMPDLEVSVVDAVHAGDRAVVHWRISGTDSGPGDFPPTNRRAEAIGLTLYRMRDGRLSDEVTLVDGISLMHQLGFTLSPPAPGPGG
jgi:predicted ester cyclase